jgi:hypothetical protein
MPGFRKLEYRNDASWKTGEEGSCSSLYFDCAERITMQISPKYNVSHWTRLDLREESEWEKAVDILRDRIQGRFLWMTERIVDVEYSGFAVLALDSLLIETLQQFKEGVDETPFGKGKPYFKKFLTKTSFGEHFNETMAGIFYDDFRCGILHKAEIKGSSKV